MATVGDVFRGWKIVLEHSPARFHISIVDDNGKTIVATTTDNLPDAMRLAEVWMLVLADDREFRTDDLAEAKRAVKTLLKDAVATMHMDDREDTQRPNSDLGEWFSRQWEGSDP